MQHGITVLSIGAFFSIAAVCLPQCTASIVGILLLDCGISSADATELKQRPLTSVMSVKKSDTAMIFRCNAFMGTIIQGLLH
jgi:hypothetical protein